MSGARHPEAPPLAVAGPSASRPWTRSLAWLAFLGPFFFATYGLANWLASLRADVPAIVFGWERAIPFVPWTIVPYWSIDALYVISLFLCATRRELDVHAKRLLVAQMICVAVFIVFPLRFIFERPETSGLAGALFDLLMGFDKPFNQMPSLHIALLVIIWVRFLRHVPGSSRSLVHGWAALIGVSALTTWQHHFIDIVTGFGAGWLCVWLVPEDGRFPRPDASALRDGRRRALAAAYGGGATALGACAALAGGWALWLFWPAVALAIVAVIYAALGETAFQKGPDGRLSSASKWLLGPYLAGAWFNAWWWTRRRSFADQIVPGLYVGRVPALGASTAYASIVDLSAEIECRPGSALYANVPQLDLTVASLEQTERAVAAIDAGARRGTVLVCCALGFSRSAFAVAAWLVASGRAADAADAMATIRRARDGVVLHEAHLKALERFAKTCAARVQEAA